MSAQFLPQLPPSCIPFLSKSLRTTINTRFSPVFFPVKMYQCLTLKILKRANYYLFNYCLAVGDKNQNLQNERSFIHLLVDFLAM